VIRFGPRFGERRASSVARKTSFLSERFAATAPPFPAFGREAPLPSHRSTKLRSSTVHPAQPVGNFDQASKHISPAIFGEAISTVGKVLEASSEESDPESWWAPQIVLLARLGGFC